MFLSWILTVLTSLILGIVITLVAEYYLYVKFLMKQKCDTPKKKFKLETFQLPKVLLDVIHCNELITKESCVALNLLLQFLFHELRDTEKIRLWFKNKLHLEFEELLSRSTIGKMVVNIQILEIDLGSEFPVINNITVQDVKVDKDNTCIDILDLKLDVNYTGGFRLALKADTLLGKAVNFSIKVNELFGEGRLQFTCLPYSHWSFAFCDEPKLQLKVVSDFQGRPFHQITHFISSQIKKSLRNKHTLPNYKIRYKPFFSATENSTQATFVSPGQLQLVIHRVSRLNEMESHNCEIYCTVAADPLPWVEIVNYGMASYYVIDVVITKKTSEVLEFIFKQELVDDKNQVCVVVQNVNTTISTSQDDICRGDIILSIDGKKVTSVNQAQKLIKSSAYQFTMRVERKSRWRVTEESSNDTTEPLPNVSPGLSVLRKRKGSESESSNSNLAPSTSSSSSQNYLRRNTFESNKPIVVPQKTIIEESETGAKILKSKIMLNKQVILFEEDFTLQVNSDDKYLNINVRAKDIENQKDKLLGYVNIPVCEVENSNDTLKYLRLKPPDSFAASSIRNHKLSSHSGFIPLLCYGDILFTVQYFPNSDAMFKSVPEIIEPSLTPKSEKLPAFLSDEKKHVFVKMNLKTSVQCGFCGKKIWLKDAERCLDCKLICHKKCEIKCKFETICIPYIESPESIVSLGEGCSNDDEIFKTDVTSENMSSRESTPQPTPTKKRLGVFLATVISASRGLKRVGSANNLALPGDPSQNSQSRSLPPSPQQSPSPSRKASLPLELTEGVTAILQGLMERTSNQYDMMDVAKSTGKSLYEYLDLPERKEKILEMINRLKTAMNAEADIRFSLMKEEQSEKDPANKAKIAFLIGKSDEKTQALTILMLHFCAGLQHIQDLEDQEKENEIAQDLGETEMGDST